MRKRVLCVLLAMVMALALLPGAALDTVKAADESSDWIVIGESYNDKQAAMKLHDLLEYPGSDYKIRLDRDIDFTIGISYKSDVKNDDNCAEWAGIPTRDLYWCHPQGTKVLDLHGHSVKIHYGDDGRNGQGYQCYLFKLIKESGDTYPDMTVTDSTASPGTITFDGYVYSPDSLLPCYHNYRNLFYVSPGSSLTVNGGRLICGRSKEQWLSRSIRIDDLMDAVGEGNTFLDSCNVFYSKRYDGYARQNVNGHAIYNAGGTVTVNGGELEGRGYKQLKFEIAVSNYPRYRINSTQERNAAIINSTGTLTIVDGVFRGTGCADAIQVLDRDNSTVSIIGGEFSVKDIDKVIAPLNDDPLEFEWRLDGYYIDGSKGRLGQVSGLDAEGLALLVDTNRSKLTAKGDTVTVLPMVQGIPREEFSSPYGVIPEDGVTNHVYDPGYPYQLRYTGAVSYDAFGFPNPLPAYSRIEVSQIGGIWQVQRYPYGGGDPVVLGAYPLSETGYTLELDKVLTDTQKASLTTYDTLSVSFTQWVTWHGTHTMDAMRQGSFNIVIQKLGAPTVTQQPLGTTVKSDLDDEFNPRIIENNQVLTNGKDITLTARAKYGTSAQWFRYESSEGLAYPVIVGENSGNTVRNTASGSVLTSTLTVHVDANFHTTYYFCTFSNPAGSVRTTNAAVGLSSYLKPLHSSLTGYTGGSVALQCVSSCRPSCEAEWKKNVNGTWTALNQLTGYSSSKYWANGLTLAINTLKEADAGTYRCYSKEGGYYADVTLDVQSGTDKYIESVELIGLGDLFEGRRVPKSSNLSVSDPRVTIQEVVWSYKDDEGETVTLAENDPLPENPTCVIRLRLDDYPNYKFKYDSEAKFNFTIDGVPRYMYSKGSENTPINMRVFSLSIPFTGKYALEEPQDTVSFDETEFTVAQNENTKISIPVTVTTPDVLGDVTPHTVKFFYVNSEKNNMPKGLTLNQSTGVITGKTSAEPGVYRANIGVYTWNGEHETGWAEEQLTFVVYDPDSPDSHIHSFSDWTADNDSTHSRTCTSCAVKETQLHSWDDGVIVKEPTEGADGQIKYTCSVCGRQITVPLAYEPAALAAAADAKLSKDGKTLTCRAVASRAVSAVMVAATYDQSGRMLESRTEKLSLIQGVPATFDMTLTKAAYRCCVYLVDAQTYVPLCKCWDYHES